MQFLSFAVLALLAAASAEMKKADKVQEKRGAAEYTQATATPTYATSAPSSVLYSNKLEQPVAQKVAYAAAEPQYQQAVKYATPGASYASPTQQYQQQAQAVAYAQAQQTKYANAPGLAKVAYQPSPVQQYSLAGDVSTFSYSSPLVQYNNLGLLSFPTGKLAAAQDAYVQPAQAQQATYSAPARIGYTQQQVQNAISAARAQQQQAEYESYEAPSQKLVFTPAPSQAASANAAKGQVAYAAQPQVYSAAPQQYLQQAALPQQYLQQLQQQGYIVQQQQAAPQQAYQPAAAASNAAYAAYPQFYQQQQYYPSNASPGVTYANN